MQLEKGDQEFLLGDYCAELNEDKLIVPKVIFEYSVELKIDTASELYKSLKEDPYMWGHVLGWGPVDVLIANKKLLELLGEDLLKEETSPEPEELKEVELIPQGNLFTSFFTFLGSVF